jgi:hypothetical protein
MDGNFKTYGSIESKMTDKMIGILAGCRVFQKSIKMASIANEQ